MDTCGQIPATCLSDHAVLQIAGHCVSDYSRYAIADWGCSNQRHQFACLPAVCHSIADTHMRHGMFLMAAHAAAFTQPP